MSSALAAPALAGIPVTHRGLSSGMVVLSGHSEEAYRPALEALRPGGLTLVVLMGLAARAEIARLLLGQGWGSDTPCAVLLAASLPSQQAWIGTLGGLALAQIQDSLGDAPGTLVIGAVVSVAETARGLLGQGRAVAYL